MSTVERRIKSVLENCLGIDKEINNSDNLVDLGLDSLDFMDLMFRIDEEFSTRLPDNFQATAETTVGDIVNFVEREIQASTT
jgi:acyl carrier protein